MAEQNRTENDALLERLEGGLQPTVEYLASPEVHGAEKNVPVMLIPKGMALHDPKAIIDQYLPRPRRRKGLTSLHTAASFVEFTRRHAGPSSVVFADHGKLALHAIFDYHDAGPESAEASRANWCEHGARLNCTPSPSWAAWAKVSGEQLVQGTFAEFIEDRGCDLIDPASLPADSGALHLAAKLGLLLASPSEVIAASKGLKLRAEVQITDAVALSSGETELFFQETHKSLNGEPLRVPSAFLIAVPVFLGLDADVLIVRLRYRRKEGRIYWIAVVHNLTELGRLAFEDVAKNVARETKLPLFFASLG